MADNNPFTGRNQRKPYLGARVLYHYDRGFDTTWLVADVIGVHPDGWACDLSVQFPSRHYPLEVDHIAVAKVPYGTKRKEWQWPDQVALLSTGPDV